MALTRVSGNIIQSPLTVGISTNSIYVGTVGSGVTINSSGINASGVITATTFVGDGAALTGLARTLTIGVRAGAAVTFNITGSSFNVSARSGSVPINV